MSTTRTDIAAEQAAAQRFALVRRIADDLAHELKNPLNAVVINLEVLRAKVRAGNAEAALERIDVVDEEVRRLHTLLDHVLRLVRPDTGEENVPADELLAEVDLLAQVLAKLGRKRITVESAGEDVVIRSARDPLRFALLALAEAALAAASDDQQPVSLHAHAGPEHLRLAVSSPSEADEGVQQAVAFARLLLEPDGVQVRFEPGDGHCTVSMDIPRTPGMRAH